MEQLGEEQWCGVAWGGEGERDGRQEIGSPGILTLFLFAMLCGPAYCLPPASLPWKKFSFAPGPIFSAGEDRRSVPIRWIGFRLVV
jgi:hypothetical protein